MTWLTEHFHRPYLLLMVLPALAYGIYMWRLMKTKNPKIKVSSLPVHDQPSTWKERWIYFPEALLLFSLFATIVAAAGPRKLLARGVEEGKGIDIVMAIDVSNSMLTQDFEPNRMEVCKTLAATFVEQRTADRIGLVTFGGAGLTQCPLTIDHVVLSEMIQQLQAGILGDGTAIGMGLATAVNRLKNSVAKSKVIILLTDGANNAGSIGPNDAAELARNLGIKVYCIGVGSNDFALGPTQKTLQGELLFGYRRSDLDEEQLQYIANHTGGLYFRAQNGKELAQIYQKIDQLEKSKLEATVFQKYTDLFYYPALAALGALLLSFVFRIHILKRWP